MDELIDITETGKREKVIKVLLPLLSAIPYVGGSLATVISNYYSDKQLHKIASAIEYLCKQIQSVDVEIAEFLTEDQTVELIHKSLNEISIASNDDKIKLLKQLLVNSFVMSDVTFELKEICLKILSDMTVPEIMLFSIVYFKPDPFINIIYPKEYYDRNTFNLSKPSHKIYASMTLPYEEDSATFAEGDKSLRDYLNSEFGDSNKTVIDGAIARLDSKGITAIRDNINDTTIKTFNMKQFNPLAVNIVNPVIQATIFSPTIKEDKDKNRTPIEKCKTEFGLDFKRMVV